MEINCLHFDRLDSTNTWSKENYKSFDPKKITLVSADQQTAGRGRYKRHWLSPAGQNIYATFTIFVEKGRADIGNIAQVSALSTIKVLEEMDFSPLLKWPNDILINKKKVAGILCETMEEEEQLIMVVGIGLNINMPKETLEQINQPATSLTAEANKKFNVAEVLEALQNHFAQDIDLFLKVGFHPFLESYRRHVQHKKGDALTLNQQKGTFHMINTDGALVMCMEDGSEQKFFSGELSV